jgi:phosphoribosyl-dephospho-CoA transferase
MSAGAQRTSQTRILERLRVASRKGDHAALALALDEMRTLAFTPRYWIKYLTLLQHPLARLVDLLVIKQGDKIARQKGWTGPRRTRSRPAKAAKPAKAGTARARRAPAPRRRSAADQPSLFPDI